MNKTSKRKNNECAFTLKTNEENLITIDRKINIQNFQIKFEGESVSQQDKKSESVIKNAKVHFQENELASGKSKVTYRIQLKEKPYQNDRNDKAAQMKKRKYQQNDKSKAIAKKSRMVNFEEGQIALVEWKGSPHWPAKIISILGNIANVIFYGTNDT